MKRSAISVSMIPYSQEHFIKAAFLYLRTMTYLQKIRHLYNIPEQQNAGFPENEITALEERLAIKLPPSLKNYYLALGKYEALNYSYNRLLKPGKEIGFSQDEYLIFYEENQVVVYWGIKKQDLTLDNPPVYGNYSGDEHNPDWQLEAATTEAFFLLMAVYNGVMGGLEYNANSLEPVDAAVVDYVRANWQELADISNPSQKVFTRDYEEMVSLSFEKEGNCSGIFIGTNDHERFDHLLDKLEVDWNYISLEDEE
jgi:hypothetical protein